MKSILTTVLILLFALYDGLGQCRKSTEGTDFWFGFMEGRQYAGSQHYTQITLSSRFNCTYSIYTGKSTTPFVSNGILLPNVPVQITIPYDQVEAVGSESVQDKAIHLVSDNALNVYALNFSQNSSEVSVIYPTASLGNEYYAMCYTPHYATSTNNKITNVIGKNSEFLIVAAYDNTTVTITPKVTTDLGKTSVFTTKLSQGEVYQVQAGNGQYPPDSGDLTGSYITSDQPVAVFSGSFSTTVPLSSNNAWDHLFEQMPPVQSWGSTFIAVPLATRGVSYYRILAQDNQTIVTIGNKPSRLLNKGDTIEYSSGTQAQMIQSTKPILLAQFSPSNSVDKPKGATKWDGDPFMVIVSPVNQTKDKVEFVAYDSPEITDKFFINVVVKDDAVGKIVLDGNVVDFISVAGTGYSYAQVSISKGNHYIESTEEGKGFIGYVYGFGGVEAYGYGVGYSLDITLDLGGDKDSNDKKYLVRCDGAGPLTLNAGNAFASYQWSKDFTVMENSVNSSIQVSEEGIYTVKATTKEGCSLYDTVRLVISKPVIDLGPDNLVVCNPEIPELDAGAGFETYQWTSPDGTSDQQKIVADQAGEYKVIGTTKYRCQASGSILISFRNKPVLNLQSLDTLVCGKKNAILALSADNGDYTLERADTGEKFQGLEAVVPQFGTFPFKFTATDPYGCFNDEIFKVGFHKIPTVSFSIDSTRCYRYNLSANYVGDATIGASEFTWIFGNDTIADGKGINSSIIPLGVNQSLRNLSLKVTEEGCSNADTIKNIKVIPDLEVQVVDTLGCQPFTAEFLAKNTEKVSYDWDFGDGTSENSNDHTFHTYQKDGFYNLKLKVTTDKGCTNSVLMDSILYVAPIPTVGFSLDPSMCLENKDNQISYAGTGNQQDTYNWDLSSFDPDELIQNPGNSQGPFIFNLKNKPQAPLQLSVISKYGCKSDIGRIIVKRKPSFDFTAINNRGCLPLNPEFSATQNDLIDQIDYSWDFGDGTTATGVTVSPLYGQANKHYNVTLSGKSQLTGCSDTVSKDTLVFVFPKPVAGFSLDHSIVYNDQPGVQFENQSQGATSYLWDFGDGSTSQEINPSNKFKGHGTRKVLLTAINDYQCTDTVSRNVLVAFNRIFAPNAFSPDAPNAVDREFKLNQEAIREEGYHLTIISRWDDIVFETKNEIKGWDGKMKNGENAPAGNYIWELDFVDFLGRVHHQNGTVTLMY